MPDQISHQVQTRFREAAALMLWKAGAIKINLDQPFKLASGNFSPIYINCRQVISDPVFMQLFVAAASHLKRSESIHADIVAGGETAGIPFAAYVAGGLSLPLIYVRKAVKGYGIGSLVEGGDVTGKWVLLVEDLITDAGSKLHFINGIKSAGGTVTDVLVLFDRLQGGGEALSRLNIRLHSVTDIETALQTAKSASLWSGDVVDSVVGYLENPGAWHQARGLEYKAMP